ncbi:hypothetical protein [Aliarcobacter butzleri]|uniref:hypothetical protein n=1 Tax=Aliarcobacter butzleri TaxID=28197 RepID=UPI003AF67931
MKKIDLNKMVELAKVTNNVELQKELFNLENKDINKSLKTNINLSEELKEKLKYETYYLLNKDRRHHGVLVREDEPSLCSNETLYELPKYYNTSVNDIREDYKDFEICGDLETSMGEYLCRVDYDIDPNKRYYRRHSDDISKGSDLIKELKEELREYCYLEFQGELFSFCDEIEELKLKEVDCISINNYDPDAEMILFEDKKGNQIAMENDYRNQKNVISIDEFYITKEEKEQNNSYDFDR